jgi:hypothetical protein
MARLDCPVERHGTERELAWMAELTPVQRAVMVGLGRIVALY